MTDTKELRRLAQAAMTGPDGVSLNWVKLLQDFQKEANPAAVSDLLDCLEAAEKDIALKERVIDSLGLGLNAAAHERDNLRAEVESWKGLAAQFGKEADKAKTHLAFAKDNLNHLRARIEAMEKQEPVAWRRRSDYGWSYKAKPVNGLVLEPLYPAPGAQPAPIIPEISDDLIEVIESRAEQSYRRYRGGIRGQQVTPADALSWHIIHATRDVLATSTEEAKPCP